MRQAAILLRPEPHYRADAFAAGLQRLGYQINYPKTVGPDDVLVLWNRKPRTEGDIRRFHAAGARVLICENGYIGQDAKGQQLYAIALDGHNGSGRWEVGGPERWHERGIDCKPWQAEKRGHIVVFAQRGIGSKDMASPNQWDSRTAGALRVETGREVIIYSHPGLPACHPRIADEVARQVEGAYCVVVWASARGVRALVEGVPVVYHAPHWIAGKAASHGVLTRRMGDRLPAFVDLAWAQWTLEEIAAGVPFTRLLELPRVAA